MKNQNVKALSGLQPEAIVAMSDNVSAKIQDVVVKSTIDYLNKPKEGKSAWQGYMVLFADTDKGARLVPISAGKLLAIQEESGTPIFENTDDGYVLTNFRMGIEEGNIIFNAPAKKGKKK